MHTSNWSWQSCHSSMYHLTPHHASSPFTHPVTLLLANLAVPSRCWPRWCVLLSFSSYQASPPWSCGSPQRNWSRTLSSSLRWGCSPLDPLGRYPHYWLVRRRRRKQRRQGRNWVINISLGRWSNACCNTMMMHFTHWGHPHVDLWCRWYTVWRTHRCRRPVQPEREFSHKHPRQLPPAYLYVSDHASLLWLWTGRNDGKTERFERSIEEIV